MIKEGKSREDFKIKNLKLYYKGTPVTVDTKWLAKKHASCWIADQLLVYPNVINLQNSYL